MVRQTFLLILVGIFGGSVVFGEVLSLSFEDRYVGNEGIPGGSNNGFEAILVGTPYYYLVHRFDNAPLALGGDRTATLHQPSDDLDIRNSYGFYLSTLGAQAVWEVNRPIKKFSSWFQMSFPARDGISKISFIDQIPGERYIVLSEQFFDLNAITTGWLEFSYENEQGFNRIKIESDEFLYFDNVIFDTIPEPSTFQMILVSVLSINFRRKK